MIVYRTRTIDPSDTAPMGPIHASPDGWTGTSCGQPIVDRRWWIDNDGRHAVTCRRCPKALAAAAGLEKQASA